MLITIASFFINIRQLFVWRIEREIYYRIFPHLRRDRNHAYPFQSDDELRRLLEREHAQAHALLETISRDSAQMPKAYGMAFRYIMYRDFNQRLKQYETLMRRCIRTDCNPKYVATKAVTP
jgi:hypothetical protein